jgi:hypothetical protein
MRRRKFTKRWICSNLVIWTFIYSQGQCLQTEAIFAKFNCGQPLGSKWTYSNGNGNFEPVRTYAFCPNFGFCPNSGPIYHWRSRWCPFLQLCPSSVPLR